MNHLYYGDNLTVLRDSIASASVDLVYLDPPFNSNASYNVLFRGPSGNQSAAQIEAFDDTDAAMLRLRLPSSFLALAPAQVLP
jgi:site-specific DNA-methyltransferase (adenine-specific)